MNSSVRRYGKAVLNIIIALIGLLLVIWLLPKVLLFLTPFLVGFLIACLAGPIVKFFEEKLKIRRKAGSAFVVVVVIGLVILCLYLIGGKLVREGIGFMEDLPAMWSAVEADIRGIGANLSVLMEKLPGDVQLTIGKIGSQASEAILTLVSGFSAPTITAVGNFAKQLPTIVIGVIMCLLSAYFFVAERGTWGAPLIKVIPVPILERLRLIRKTIVKAVGGYFKAQFKIEVWIYLLLVAGLMILQVDYVLLVALGIAILDFLPFFGTGTIMVPWAILKFLSADYKMTIGLLIIWGVGQLVRQVIQPKIVGDSMGMPPLPTLFLLYVGYMVAGVIGMILAVPIGIVVVSLYREGAFDTTRESVQILAAGLQSFRRINKEDRAFLEEYRKQQEQEKKEKKYEEL